ncbi:MAG: hypothetical protein E6Q97_34285 [Desulfurellales bacterium]|nr:MAG: hypothetical protein E6Q97_34285 [Desulfurellales bacterium]
MIDDKLNEKEAQFERELADLIQKHVPLINVVGVVGKLKDTLAYLLSLSDRDEIITMVINQLTVQTATHRFNRIGAAEAMKEIDNVSDKTH